jgi:hypothetical protein
MKGTGRPFVFLCYAERNQTVIEAINDSITKQKIQSYPYPYDSPELRRPERSDKGESVDQTLLSQLKEISSPSKVLAVSLSAPDPKLTSQVDASRHWFSERLPALLAHTRGGFEHVFLLKLSDDAELESLWAKAIVGTDASTVDFRSDISAGIDALIGALPGLSPVAAPKPAKRPRIPLVQGILQPDRPYRDLLTQLQHEVRDGRMSQKYLYWDMRAAERWYDICYHSRYEYATATVNLLTQCAKDIAEHVAGPAAPEVTFINLGVGDGRKDYTILDELQHKAKHVLYFGVDESFPMIQLTMDYLRDEDLLQYGKIDLHYVVDDFLNPQRYKEFIHARERETSRGGKRVRLVAILGGTFGNYDERALLAAASQLLGPGDFLLIGAELVAGRAHHELTDGYSHSKVLRFISGPIADLDPSWDVYSSLAQGLASDATPPTPSTRSAFKFDVVSHPENSAYSRLPGSETITGAVQYIDHEVALFYATKYEGQSLRSFMRQQHFEIIKEYQSPAATPRFVKLLLRQDSSS